jgi:translation elongation factor EF-1alpha
MYMLGEQDINRLIVACNKMIMNSSNNMTQKEYQHVINRLSTYKEQNFPKRS